MSIILNPNCSELVIRVYCSRKKALQLLNSNGINSVQLSNKNIWFEDCESSFMCGDCDHDAFSIMRKIAVLFDSEVYPYDGGNIENYEDWLDGSKNPSSIEEYWEDACRKLDDFLYYD